MIRPVGQGAREPGTWLWLSFHKGRGILETSCPIVSLADGSPGSCSDFTGSASFILRQELYFFVTSEK